MAQNALMRPWSFEVADVNALTKPIVAGYDAGMKDRQVAVENRRADEQLGMQRERLGMEKAREGRAAEAEVAQRVGRVAKMYLDEQDPARRDAIGRQMMGSHPQLAAKLQADGHNVSDLGSVAKYLVAEAGLYDPIGEEQKRAQIAASRASTAASNAQLQQISRQTPEWRMQNAGRFGIDVNTPEGKAFVISGQYTPATPKVGHAPEGSTFYQTDKNGNTTFLSPPGGEGPGGDKKFAEAAATSFVKRYADNMDQGLQAKTQVSDIDRLQELSAAIGTQGAAANIKSALGPYANAVGIKIDGLNEIQAFTAIVSKLAPAMRPPGSGATSDFEFKQYLAALPQLAQTTEGRKQIIDQMRAMNNYKVALGDISEQVLNRKINRVQAEEQIKALGSPLASWRQNPEALPPARPAQQSSTPPIVQMTGQIVQQGRQLLQSGQIDPQAMIASALSAIQGGAPREAVIQRLQQLGIPIPPELMGQQTPQPAAPGQRRGTLNREVIRGNP